MQVKAGKRGQKGGPKEGGAEAKRSCPARGEEQGEGQGQEKRAGIAAKGAVEHFQKEHPHDKAAKDPGARLGQGRGLPAVTGLGASEASLAPGRRPKEDEGNPSKERATRHDSILARMLHANFDQPPVPELEDPVGPGGDLRVVGDEHHPPLAPGLGEEELEHLGPGA